MSGEAALLARQLGRPPRGEWRVATRCSHGAPVVVATAPLVDGAPFPTLLWLACPLLVAVVSALESAGGVARQRERLAVDAALGERMRAADAAYRARRAEEGGGFDPCAGTGIAGQRDPLATKCLHAHAAAWLAGIDDPVGENVLAGMDLECDDARCLRAGEERA